MLVGVRGEAVDRVRTPLLLEVLELPWCQLPIGVVRDAGHVVRSQVCCAPDVLCPDLNIVGVDQETEFSELAHHRGGLKGEVGEDTDDGLVIFV